MSAEGEAGLVLARMTLVMLVEEGVLSRVAVRRMLALRESKFHEDGKPAQAGIFAGIRTALDAPLDEDE